MTDLAPSTDDNDGLCRSAFLRSGQHLHRSVSEPRNWRSDTDAPGREAPLLDLLKDISRRNDVTRSYDQPGNADATLRIMIADLRALFAGQFALTMYVHGNGIHISDELDDPQYGQHRFYLEGGNHLPRSVYQPDPAIGRWVSLGPTPLELRRCFHAAHFVSHALNIALGMARAPLSDLDQVPTRPWRILETEDQIFVMDAWDTEIMSLRTTSCQILSPVSKEANLWSDRLIRSVNALNRAGF